MALGAAVATATAFITDLDGEPDGGATARAGIVATIANIGGLALGPLIAGVLARYAGHGLTLPFVVFLAILLAAIVLVVLAPEGNPPLHPRPRYRPQRLAAPADGRRPFLAATTGAFMSFAVFGLFAGLAGTFLAGPLHHPSPALTGTTIFVTFAAGVLVQTTTTGWPPHRLLKAGIAPTILGLVILVASAWTSPPSLALFLIGGVVVGAGGGAILGGSLAVVIAASDPAERASALTTVFAAGYAGVSLPVVGAGLALQHLSPRVTLLIFGATVGAAILAASRVLVRASGSEQRPGHDSDDDHVSMLRRRQPRVCGARSRADRTKPIAVPSYGLDPRSMNLFGSSFRRRFGSAPRRSARRGTDTRRQMLDQPSPGDVAGGRRSASR